MKSINEAPDHLSDKLISYLKDELKNPKIEYGSTLTPLLGGYQTLTYCFRLNGVKDDLSKSLVLRLYPQSFSTDFVIWESTLQNGLWKEGFPFVTVISMQPTSCSMMGTSRAYWIGGVF